MPTTLQYIDAALHLVQLVASLLTLLGLFAVVVLFVWFNHELFPVLHLKIEMAERPRTNRKCTSSWIAKKDLGCRSSHTMLPRWTALAHSRSGFHLGRTESTKTGQNQEAASRGPAR